MALQVTLQSKPRMFLAGLSFFGDPFHSHAGWTEENEIGRLWQRLLGCLPENHPTVMYEVHVQNDETLLTGEFEVFVGYEIPTPDNVPYAMCIKVLPETDYAIFTLQGTQIHQDEPIVDQWLHANGYKIAYPFYLQQYDQRFKGMDQLEESLIDFLVPVRRDG